MAFDTSFFFPKWIEISYLLVDCWTLLQRHSPTGQLTSWHRTHPLACRQTKLEWPEGTELHWAHSIFPTPRWVKSLLLWRGVNEREERREREREKGREYLVMQFSQDTHMETGVLDGVPLGACLTSCDSCLSGLFFSMSVKGLPAVALFTFACTSAFKRRINIC